MPWTSGARGLPTSGPAMIRSLLLLCCCGFLAAAADFDLVIRNARIADGSGAPLVNGGVAVKDRRIVQVGAVSGTATVEVDAHGQVVAPGFIDVHTHSVKIAENPVAENFPRMGVTTIVSGYCGGSCTNAEKVLAAPVVPQVALHLASPLPPDSDR